jgi:transketolase
MHVGVVNMHTIKPIDSVLLRKLASKTGRVLAVEDHGVVGGLGSAVLEVLGDLPDVVVHTHGVRGYGESGTHEELYARHRLDAAGIAAVAKERFWANSRAKAAS